MLNTNVDDHNLQLHRHHAYCVCLHYSHLDGVPLVDVTSFISLQITSAEGEYQDTTHAPNVCCATRNQCVVVSTFAHVLCLSCVSNSDYHCRGVPCPSLPYSNDLFKWSCVLSIDQCVACLLVLSIVAITHTYQACLCLLCTKFGLGKLGGTLWVRWQIVSREDNLFSLLK